MTTTSKKQVKTDNFYLTILLEINKKPQSLKEVSEFLGVSKQNINYYTRQLKKKNLILKKGYGVWEITEEGKNQLKFLTKSRQSKNFSIGTNKTKKKDDKNIQNQGRDINLHALNIDTRIISGKINFKDIGGYLQKKFVNWQPSYKKIAKPIGLTWRNNNNKSISIFVWSRKIIELNDVYTLINRALIFTYQELLKHHVTIDIYDFTVKNMHIWVKDDEIDKVLNKGMKFEVLLNRGCALNSSQPAKAWADSSPFKGLESNDLQYMENYIKMPEYVKQSLVMLAGMTESNKELLEAINLEIQNKKLHMKVLNDISDTLKDMKNFVKKSKAQTTSPKPHLTSQRKIGDYL